MRPKGPNYTVPTDEEILGYNNVPVEVAARYIGASTATLYEALQDERAPFGFAVLRASNWSYNISPGGADPLQAGGAPDAPPVGDPGHRRGGHPAPAGAAGDRLRLGLSYIREERMTMPGNDRNCYKIARRAAGLTQEAAAERLGLSVESIRAYETGGRVPPSQVVELMVILYNAQHLAYQHLHETNELYNRIVPALEDRDLIRTAVVLRNRLARMEQRRSLDRLLEIAEDDRIDEDERPEFLAIVAELREIVRSALELQLHCPAEEG